MYFKALFFSSILFSTYTILPEKTKYYAYPAQPKHTYDQSRKEKKHTQRVAAKQARKQLRKYKVATTITSTARSVVLSSNEKFDTVSGGELYAQMPTKHMYHTPLRIFNPIKVLLVIFAFQSLIRPVETKQFTGTTQTDALSDHEITNIKLNGITHQIACRELYDKTELAKSNREYAVAMSQCLIKKENYTEAAQYLQLAGEMSTRSTQIEESQLHSFLYAECRDRYQNNRSTYASDSVDAHKKSCTFCSIHNSQNDQENLVLARFKYNNIMLNLFPYSKGHLLIVPNDHIEKLTDLTKDARQELIELISESVDILHSALGTHGTNVGINLGKAAGATKPDHLHVQIVPRKYPDSSFMQIIAKTSVPSCDLGQTYEELKKLFTKLENRMKSK